MERMRKFHGMGFEKITSWVFVTVRFLISWIFVSRAAISGGIKTA
jgi:hypothetical protein